MFAVFAVTMEFVDPARSDPVCEESAVAAACIPEEHGCALLSVWSTIEMNLKLTRVPEYVSFNVATRAIDPSV
jgi:hypothetical protein